MDNRLGRMRPSFAQEYGQEVEDNNGDEALCVSGLCSSYEES